MRISIHVDGATTEAIRELAAALSQANLRETLTIGCDGPEKWTATTPMLTPAQHARVVAALVRFEGAPIAEALDELRAARSA